MVAAMLIPIGGGARRAVRRNEKGDFVKASLKKANQERKVSGLPPVLQKLKDGKYQTSKAKSTRTAGANG